ncbi:MAG TPA: carbohydrate binding domain-containing protein [Mobilitalea sp.]|nr:carbohydrate binding domain-containing protein [Mobilitalea sp.]
MSKKQRNVLKKLTTIVLAALFLITSVTPAFAKENTKAPAFNATKKAIVIGNSFDFNINNKVKGSTYEWKSSNEKIAAINKTNGLVTGVSKGNATITCKVKTPSQYLLLTAKVTVVKPAVKVAITNPVKNLKLKAYYKLKISFVPASSNDIVSWSSSDKSIADVDSDGAFVAKKAGTVTITATTLCNRSASITIKILGVGEVAETKPTTPAAGGDTQEQTGNDVKVLEKVYSEDFSSSLGKFVGRGSAVISQTTAGVAAEGGKGYMKITGRTANWNGALIDLTSVVKPGLTYRVTGWVRYTTGGDTEVIKITQERTSSDENKWVGVTGDVTVKKGEWTKITGTLEVSPSTTQCSVYFEANNLIDFFADNFAVEQLDVPPIVQKVEQVEPAKVGDVVYSNDFEDGKSVLDSRGSSARTNTTAVAKSGKSSVQVTRTAGWDGAGVRFTSDNKIKLASLYGKTVHTSFYVMYKDGPDSVQFKLNNNMEKADDSDNILLQTEVKKGEWTLLEADCFIADGATGNLIFVETENNDALTFYVDDVNIKVVK